ncbi:MAG: hypothetical protein IT435_04680 [Phycisphaerales bacterium]|nr:hypothetical protein [Phycisphaerales bacterium]
MEGSIGRDRHREPGDRLIGQGRIDGPEVSEADANALGRDLVEIGAISHTQSLSDVEADAAWEWKGADIGIHAGLVGEIVLELACEHAGVMHHLAVPVIEQGGADPVLIVKLQKDVSGVLCDGR